MRKKDRNSAQCAWLFCHAHLSGETSVEFEDRVQTCFSSSLVLDVLEVVGFFVVVVLFLVFAVFAAGFDLTVFGVDFRAVLFGFPADWRCCFSRSSRSSSSWLGLSISMQ